MASRFSVSSHLKLVLWMTPKWLWTSQGQMYLIFVLPVPPSAKSFTPFCSVDHPFLSYRTLCDKSTEWPKMTLNTTNSKVSHMFHYYPWVLYFNPFRVFELQMSLRQLRRMTPNDVEQCKVKGTTQISYYYSRIFNSLRSTASVFELQAILRQVHWMTQKWPSILQGQRKRICSIVTRESEISIRFALRPAVFEFQTILRHLHRMAQHDLAHYLKAKVPQIWSTSTPVSKISIYFALQSVFFKLQAILKQVLQMTPKWP